MNLENTLAEEKGGRTQFAKERQNRLLEMLRAQGSLAVTDTARQLRVSELTIRRDINALAARGLVNRVHGGATLLDSRSPFSSAASQSQRRGLSPRYTFGVIVPSLEYYWPSVIAGMRSAAAEAQVRLVLRSSSYSLQDDQRHAELMSRTPGIDALIIAPDVGDPNSPQFLRWLDKLPMPVMLAERKPPATVRVDRLEWATSDHAAGAAMAVRHLHAQGHRRIGLLVHSPSRSNPQLQRGWRDELQTLGLEPESQLMSDADGFNESRRNEVMDRMLKQCRETGTTAVIINPDPATLAFQQHCVDAGLSIPDDLAIVAYDDELAALGHPPITAVLPPKHHVGRLAVELLVARLVEGARRPPHRVEIAPVLNERESTLAGHPLAPSSRASLP